MPTSPCSDCGAPLSPAAAGCPSCGRREFNSWHVRRNAAGVLCFEVSALLFVFLIVEQHLLKREVLQPLFGLPASLTPWIIVAGTLAFLAVGVILQKDD